MVGGPTGISFAEFGRGKERAWKRCQRNPRRRRARNYVVGAAARSTARGRPAALPNRGPKEHMPRH
eukprot:307416-Alexandrium_andersonii.AAC.1